MFFLTTFSCTSPFQLRKSSPIMKKDHLLLIFTIVQIVHSSTNFKGVLPLKMDLSKALQACKSLKGALDHPDDLSLITDDFAACGDEFMAPFQKLPEGQWVDVNTNDYKDLTDLWKPDLPNELQECSVFAKDDGKLSDIACNVKKCFVCSWESPQSFKLKGICEESDLDPNFFLSFDEASNNFVIRGQMNSSFIVFNQDNATWDIVQAESFDQIGEGLVLGVYKPKNAIDLPLGKKGWSLQDETCPGAQDLKLTNVNNTII